MPEKSLYAFADLEFSRCFLCETEVKLGLGYLYRAVHLMVILTKNPKSSVYKTLAPLPQHPSRPSKCGSSFSQVSSDIL
jgi:hypothetical protein